MNRSRRRILTVLALSALLPAAAVARAPGPEVLLYKDPSCGCCVQWAEHMQRSGFQVVARDVSNLAAITAARRVPEPLGSCHTALVAGYTIEGHVPAQSVRRLLAQRPTDVIGLAVPGMPPGSPGMETPRPQRYDVLAFDARGAARVFERH